MDDAKRARLEAAGFKVGTVAEFLGLTPAESSLIETRLALSDALKERRRTQNITQVSLARRMKSSQSRIAKIEAADSTVSLDLMARAFFETGASVQDFASALVRKKDKELATV